MTPTIRTEFEFIRHLGNIRPVKKNMLVVYRTTRDDHTYMPVRADELNWRTTDVRGGLKPPVNMISSYAVVKDDCLAETVKTYPRRPRVRR